jgi:hypothetical protein
LDQTLRCPENPDDGQMVAAAMDRIQILEDGGGDA